MANATLSKDEILEAIGQMSVVDLADLIEAFKAKFNVTIAAAAPAAAAPAGAAPAAAEEEQSEFTVVLKEAGAKKIQVIKVVRELTGLGLKEAKDLVDGAPGNVKEGVAKADAQAWKAKLEEQSEFTVVLKEAGAKKIQVIKVVRELTGLGLKEAKDLVDGAPGNVKEGVAKADAQAWKAKLEEQGATVELK